MHFPRVIHQIWLQGCEKVKPLYKQNMSNWQSLNPTWNYQCHDNRSLRRLCYEFSVQAGKTYDTFQYLHQKVDFGRYVILYLIGGIYVDFDCYALRSLDSSKVLAQFIHQVEKHDRRMLGLSKSMIAPLDAAIYSKGKYSIFLGNGVMLCSPGQRVLRSYIEHIIDIMNKRPNAGIQETTGPHEFNMFMQPRFIQQRSTDVDAIWAFDATVFEPCQLNSWCKLTDDTVSLHVFEGSWVSPFMKKTSAFYFDYKPAIWTMVITLILLLICLRV